MTRCFVSWDVHSAILLRELATSMAQHRASTARVTVGAGGCACALVGPYLWLLLFFLAPFFIMLKISLADPLVAQPPFTPLA